MAKIKAPEIYVDEVAYNAAVEATYRTVLQELIYKMAQDVFNQVKRSYVPAAEEIGMDAVDPVLILRNALRKVGVKWTTRFNKMSDDIAKSFANRSMRTFDAAFREKLKKAGFTVKFRPTKRMISAYRATVAEQVNLIRSIPKKFLTEVQSIVWVNVIKGYDLKELSSSLTKQYGITQGRASLIARDQAAKAKAVFEEARRNELGITEAEWRHSHAGRVPRPTHVAMHGKRYKIKEGMWDPAVDKFIWPGTEINCRCRSRSIIPVG